MKLFALGKDQGPRRELEVEDVWPHKGMLVLKFRGVDSISDAEVLIGSELQVPSAERAELEPGWTYVSDLIGCVVVDRGSEIGRIEDVEFGAGEAPLLIVVNDAGKKFEVPFAEAYLEGVDTAQRQVRMNLPQGMLEINAPVTPEEKQEQARPEKEKQEAETEKRKGKGENKPSVFLCVLCGEGLGFQVQMKADILTIFPGFFHGPLEHGITRRACEMGLAKIEVHDLRQFTHDRHRTVDDRPFGGGEGMVLKPEPLFESLESLQLASREDRHRRAKVSESVILLSAQGQRFTQKVATELAALDRVVLICGRYEGVDERVADFLADRELSIGDYVLSGGEMAAAVIIEAITRLLPGALGNEASSRQESFTAQAKSAATRLARMRVRIPLAVRVDCSTTRTTRVPLIFAGCRCQKFWSTATTRRFAAGVASERWKKRCATVRIC